MYRIVATFFWRSAKSLFINDVPLTLYRQLNTPWSDGVPGLTQKPILPGGTFTYRWTATEYGTYWYHAHARSLMADGLYGAIWIKCVPRWPSILCKD